jgi:hypothetical protein
VWYSWERNAQIRQLALATIRSTGFVATSQRGDAIRIFTSAIEYLIETGFNADTRPQGTRPSAAQIATALTRGYNATFRGEHPANITFDRASIADGGVLLTAFSDFVSANAARLGLVGRKPAVERAPKQHESSPIKAETAAARVLASPAEFSAIEEISRSMPANVELRAISAEARGIDKQLRAMGQGEAALTTSLRKVSLRNQALRSTSRLSALRDRATAIRVRATVDFGDPRIARYRDQVMGDSSAWIDAHASELPIPRRDFEAAFDAALRNYIAIWLAEQPAGEVGSQFDVSEAAFRKAMLLIDGDFGSSENLRAVRGLIGRIFHHAARKAAARLSADEAAPTDGVAETRADSTIGARHQQQILTPQDLERVIGPDIYRELDAHFERIRSGATGVPEARREEVSRNFFEFILHYMRRAQNEYGDAFGADHIRRFGLEPRITRAIFFRVDGAAERFDGTVMAEVQGLFRSIAPGVAISDPRAITPSREEIRLARGVADGKAPGEDGFIPYALPTKPLERTTLRSFISQVLGTEDPSFRDDFKYITGITWDAFLRWGEVRENPNSIPQIHWDRIAENYDAIIALARANGDGTDDTYETLRELADSYVPKSIDQAEWRMMLAAAPDGAALATLVARNRPKAVTDELWKMYANWLVSVGRAEDITVEPSSDSMDALLIAYDFLSEEAERHGQRIDFMEYLASIYPVVGRLIARAHGGEIELPEPEIMHGLFYEIWSHMTWSRQVHDEGYEAFTDVVPGTFNKHRAGEITPEFWDVRRYATPALARRLGIDQELLYEIVGGYLRSVYPIIARASVYDTRGGRISHRTPGLSSRYSIRFRTVEAESTMPGDDLRSSAMSDRAVDDMIRRGIFERHIEYLRAYIGAVRSLDDNATFTFSDGSELPLAAVEAELQGISRSHIVQSSIFRDNSTTSASYSPDQLRRVRNFYRTELDGFMRRILFDSTVDGRTQINGQVVPFRFAFDGGTTVPVDAIGIAAGNIVAEAAHEMWSPGRLADVMHADAIAQYQLATGMIPQGALDDERALAAAVLPMWRRTASPQTAAATYVDARRNGARHLEYYPGIAHQNGTPRRSAATTPRNPVLLPPNQSMRGLFERHVARTAADDETRDVAYRGLCRYLDAIGFARQRFWPNTLLRILHEIDPGRAGNAYSLITSFLPRIGVASERTPSATIPLGGSIEDDIANSAFGYYITLFPTSREATYSVPINAGLVLALISLHLEDMGTATVDREHIFRQVLGRIERYNDESTTEAAAPTELPDSGLLGVLVGEAGRGVEYDSNLVHRAYFGLKGRIAADDFNDDEITAALASVDPSSPHPQEAELLKGLLSNQRTMMSGVRELISNPTYGLKSYMESHYDVRGIDVTALEGLASAYAADRLAGNLPVELRQLAMSFVDPSLLQYPQVAAHIAGTYADLVAEWIVASEGTMREQLDTAELGSYGIASDRKDPPKTLDELKARTAASVPVPTFEDLLATERRYGLLRFITSGAIPPPRIEHTVKSEFDGTAKGVRDGLDAELMGLVARAASFQRRSAAILLRVNAVSEGAGDEETLARRLAELDASYEILTGLRTESKAVADIGDRAAEIVAARRTDAAHDQVADAIRSVPDVDAEMSPDMGSAAFTSRLVDIAMGDLDAAETAYLGKLDANQRLHGDAVQGRVTRDASSSLDAVDGAISLISAEIAGVDGELAKLQSEAMAGLSVMVDSEIPSSSASYAAYAAAEARLAGTAKAAEATIVAAEAHSSRLKVLIEGGKGEGEEDGRKAVAEILREAYAALPTNGGLSDALSARIIELEGLVPRARGKMSEVETSASNARAKVGETRKALARAEAALPIAAPLDIKRTEYAAERTAEDAELIFRSGEIRRQDQRLTAQRISPIANGYVLSTAAGGYFISQADAALVRAWMDGERREAITITTALGLPVTLAAAQTGVRTSSVKDLPSNSPHQRVAKCLRTIMDTKSYEAMLVADLVSNERTRGAEAMDLFARLAELPEGASREAIRQEIALWAGQNSYELRRKLGEGRYFERPQNHAVHDGRYTPEMHSNLRWLYEQQLTNLDMGILHVANRTPAGSATVFAGPIDISKTPAEHIKRTGRATYYSSIEGKWIDVDLRTMPGTTPLSSITVATLHETSTPEMTRQFAYNWAMTSDESLMELSWLYQISVGANYGATLPADTPERSFHDFVQGLLRPIYHTPFGSQPPMSLADAQTMAVRGFRLVSGETRTVDPDEVLPDAVAALIEATLHDDGTSADDKISFMAKVNTALKNPISRRRLSMFYLLFSYLEGSMPASFSLDAALDPETRQWPLDADFPRLSHRIYANMHAPLFATPDAALAAAHPETAKVGRGQLWAILKAMEPAMSGDIPDSLPRENVSKWQRRFPLWMRPAIQRLPHLANMLAIIFATYERLPDDFHFELFRLCSKAIVEVGSRGATTAAALGEEFKRLYDSQAQAGVAGHDAIIRAMGADFSDGFTLAGWLTGEDAPWVRTPSSWHESRPVDALRLRLPELMKARGDVLSFLERDTAEPTDFRNKMLRFLRRHPELRSPLAIMYIIIAKLNDGNRARFADFLTGVDTATDRQFVTLLTDIEFMRDIRAALAGPFAAEPDISLAMQITGEERPGLPTRLLPPAQRLALIAPEVDAIPDADVAQIIHHFQRNRIRTGVAKDAIARLESLVARHPEFKKPVAALLISFVTIRRDAVRSIYSAICSLEQLTPANFVDTVVEHRLVPQFRRIAANAGRLETYALLPTYDLDRVTDLTPTDIEEKIDAIGVLPPADSPEFERLAAASGFRRAEPMPASSPMPLPGSLAGMSGDETRAQVLSIIDSMNMAQRKMFILLRLIDPTGGLVSECRRYVEEKGPAMRVAVARQEVSGTAAINAMQAQYMYEFFVLNRDRILGLADSHRESQRTKAIDELLPPPHADEAYALPFGEIERQADALGLLPPEDSLEYKALRVEWVNDEVERTMRLMRQQGGRISRRRAEAAVRDNISKFPPLYVKLVILCMAADDTRALDRKITAEFEEAAFFLRGERTTESDTKAKFDRLVVGLLYKCIVQKRDAFIAAAKRRPAATAAAARATDPLYDVHRLADTMGRFLAGLLPPEDEARGDFDLQYIEDRLDALHLLPDEESPEFAGLVDQWRQGLTRLGHAGERIVGDSPLVFKKAMLILMRLSRGNQFEDGELSNLYSPLSGNGDVYTNSTIATYRFFVRHRNIVLREVAAVITNAARETMAATPKKDPDDKGGGSSGGGVPPSDESPPAAPTSEGSSMAAAPIGTPAKYRAPGFQWIDTSAGMQFGAARFYASQGTTMPLMHAARFIPRFPAPVTQTGILPGGIMYVAPHMPVSMTTLGTMSTMTFAMRPALPTSFAHL